VSTRLGYGSEVTSRLDFAETLGRVRDALKSEGFGVLCEIDVAKTLKEKIGKDLPPYVILGTCNPELASRALSAEPRLGLLLPCNVVVSEEPAGTKIAAIDAQAMLGVVHNAALDPIAAEVNARLSRVLEALS
jgi:uncharacterized protein (DUF302 family)